MAPACTPGLAALLGFKDAPGSATFEASRFPELRTLREGVTLIGAGAAWADVIRGRNGRIVLPLGHSRSSRADAGPARFLGPGRMAILRAPGHGRRHDPSLTRPGARRAPPAAQETSTPWN
jgi:hypothetical protein